MPKSSEYIVVHYAVGTQLGTLGDAHTNLMWSLDSLIIDTLRRQVHTRPEPHIFFIGRQGGPEYIVVDKTTSARSRTTSVTVQSRSISAAAE